MKCQSLGFSSVFLAWRIVEFLWGERDVHPMLYSHEAFTNISDCYKTNKQKPTDCFKSKSTYHLAVFKSLQAQRPMTWCSFGVTLAAFKGYSCLCRNVRSTVISVGDTISQTSAVELPPLISCEDLLITHLLH